MTTLLRNGEALYWKEKFAECNDSKSFWKTVAEATGRHRGCKIGILKGVNNDNLVDECNKAERLNSFFCECREGINRKITQHR